ncbi:MAG: hypothetical protein J6I31_08615 [Prevotella sp.]|nr:hypothetical protein [Prevotella sp.]
MKDFAYNNWKVMCFLLYAQWMPIFFCFFFGAPPIIVWIVLVLIVACCGLQLMNIYFAVKEGEYLLSLKILILTVLGVVVGTFPVFLNTDYSIKYMFHHNIFLSFP